MNITPSNREPSLFVTSTHVPPFTHGFDIQALLDTTKEKHKAEFMADLCLQLHMQEVFKYTAIRLNSNSTEETCRSVNLNVRDN